MKWPKRRTRRSLICIFAYTTSSPSFATLLEFLFGFVLMFCDLPAFTCYLRDSHYHCSGAEMQGEFASIDSERWFALVMEVTLCLPGNKKARQRGGHRLAGPGCGHTASNPASFRTTANSMSLCNLVQSCISCVISR